MCTCTCVRVHIDTCNLHVDMFNEHPMYMYISGTFQLKNIILGKCTSLWVLLANVVILSNLFTSFLQYFAALHRL